MGTNEFKGDGIDKALKQMLQEYSQQVPKDFSAKLMEQLRAERNRKLLGRIILRERLTLAGCVVAIGVFAVSIILFPGFITRIAELCSNFGYIVSLGQEGLGGVLLSLVLLTAVLLYSLYNLVDLLLGQD